MTNIAQTDYNDKGVDGVLGTQTLVGRMVGADESTELWGQPSYYNFYVLTVKCMVWAITFQMSHKLKNRDWLSRSSASARQSSKAFKKGADGSVMHEVSSACSCRSLNLTKAVAICSLNKIYEKICYLGKQFSIYCFLAHRRPILEVTLSPKCKAVVNYKNISHFVLYTDQ